MEGTRRWKIKEKKKEMSNKHKDKKGILVVHTPRGSVGTEERHTHTHTHRHV